MTRLPATCLQFLGFFVLTTIICCIVWEYTAADLYDIDDPFFPAYLEPGSWAVAWGGHPVVTVARIVHAHDMGRPDTIKEGWSFVDLWKLWWGFLSASLVVSVLAVLVKWGRVFVWNPDELHKKA